MVDLESQREATVNQIKELEQNRNDAQGSINANEKTIKELKRMMESAAPKVAKNAPLADDNEATRFINKKIINLRKQVAELTNNIIDGTGNKRKNQSLLRSVKKQLDDEMKALARLQKDKVILIREFGDNTMANELFEKHLDATIELTNAKEEIAIIEQKLGELRSRAKSYVSDEAYVTNLEREIDMAKEDYEFVVKKLEEERLETSKDESPLTIIEHAQLPETAESDRKLLFTAFSGIVGASMATFFHLFLGFFG